MYRVIVFPILFLCYFSSCAHEEKESENIALLHLKLGTAHLAKGNYPQALSELKLAHTLNPNDPITANNIGLAYYIRSKFVLAEHYTRKALSLNPTYTEARNNLGRILIEQGLYEEAKNELFKCTRDLTYPFPGKSWSNLGIAHFRSGHFKRAKKSFRKSVEFNNKTCQTLGLYGRSFFELKNYQQATKILDWALRVCGSKMQAAPHFYSALAYFQLGHNEETLARLREIINHYPNSYYANKANKMLSILTR